jgi:hypothetical protein
MGGEMSRLSATVDSVFEVTHEASNRHRHPVRRPRRGPCRLYSVRHSGSHRCAIGRTIRRSEQLTRLVRRPELEPWGAIGRTIRRSVGGAVRLVVRRPSIASDAKNVFEVTVERDDPRGSRPSEVAPTDATIGG